MAVLVERPQREMVGIDGRRIFPDPYLHVVLEAKNARDMAIVAGQRGRKGCRDGGAEESLLYRPTLVFRSMDEHGVFVVDEGNHLVAIACAREKHADDAVSGNGLEAERRIWSVMSEALVQQSGSNRLVKEEDKGGWSSAFGSIISDETEGHVVLFARIENLSRSGIRLGFAFLDVEPQAFQIQHGMNFDWWDQRRAAGGERDWTEACKIIYVNTCDMTMRMNGDLLTNDESRTVADDAPARAKEPQRCLEEGEFIHLAYCCDTGKIQLWRNGLELGSCITYWIGGTRYLCIPPVCFLEAPALLQSSKLAQPPMTVLSCSRVICTVGIERRCLVCVVKQELLGGGGSSQGETSDGDKQGSSSGGGSAGEVVRSVELEKDEAASRSRWDSMVDEICERVTSQVLCCLLQVSQMWVTSEHWVERVCCVEDEAAATTHPPVGSGRAGEACTWRKWSKSIHVRNNLLVNTKNEFAAAMVDGGLETGSHMWEFLVIQDHGGAFIGMMDADLNLNACWLSHTLRNRTWYISHTGMIRSGDQILVDTGKQFGQGDRVKVQLILDQQTCQLNFFVNSTLTGMAWRVEQENFEQEKLLGEIRGWEQLNDSQLKDELRKLSLRAERGELKRDDP
ncbi:hypothetical protein GUITHDRAFT_107608 [Guillardia theta CCMP2712]|uniref:SPRY domain-containing protein n=1 Tax=Guillardia theta (strain CCMP2712) TaxID=905079 RepID=L1JE70_GUITC|nr:hypothetical protein GUITHDRAFT_107608 [Guillardia theta CCMP2712]EKX46405.1 hypothetical protein GUITHDRAFT_107608 [Guillardia theta CCMP2712]|eukprot:XP_005833385.1 hypothetical protein GUITHDRAFT_107608 [Guillardia theta CCMP2712]